MSAIHNWDILDDSEDSNHLNFVELVPKCEWKTQSLSMAGYTTGAVLAFGYLALVVHLCFTLYDMSQVALFVLALLGSFAFPVVLPAILLILLSTGVIREHTSISLA